MTHPTAGDKVKFNARHETLEGTVIRTRTKRRRRRTRDLAYAVTGDGSALDCEVAEISASDGRIWTVPISSVQEVTGKGDLSEAYQAKNAIVRANNKRASDKFTEGYDKLKDVEYGADIEVEFRNGWETVRFNGFVRGSGKVRFQQHGKNRTTHPQYVRTISKES